MNAPCTITVHSAQHTSNAQLAERPMHRAFSSAFQPSAALRQNWQPIRENWPCVRIGSHKAASHELASCVWLTQHWLLVCVCGTGTHEPRHTGFLCVAHTRSQEPYRPVCGTGTHEPRHTRTCVSHTQASSVSHTQMSRQLTQGSQFVRIGLASLLAAPALRQNSHALACGTVDIHLSMLTYICHF